MKCLLYYLWRYGFLSFYKLLLCYLFSFNLHAWSSPTQRITPRHLLHYIFENLRWDFAVRICRRNLPWLFAVGFFICKQIFFCICAQSLFIWKQIFFICEQNLFICEIFLTKSVSFCYCRGSYVPSCNLRVKLPLYRNKSIDLPTKWVYYVIDVCSYH